MSDKNWVCVSIWHPSLALLFTCIAKCVVIPIRALITRIIESRIAKRSWSASCSIDNTGGEMAVMLGWGSRQLWSDALRYIFFMGYHWSDSKVKHRAVSLIARVMYFDTRIFSQGTSGGGSECDNRISDVNFLIGFRGTIFLSFRDMTTERTTDGRRTDVR